MEIEVAREYYALSETQKSIHMKKKRLLSEIDGLDERHEREDKRAKRLSMQIADCDMEEIGCHAATVKLKSKYKWQHKSAIEDYRMKLMRKVARIDTQVIVHQKRRQRLYFYVGNIDLYTIRKQAKQKGLKTELYNLPYARSLFVIPAITLPLPFHPNRQNLCFETGILDADIWHNVLSSLDRSTLRSLRLCNISFAILVHSLPPAITGYHFCV